MSWSVTLFAGIGLSRETESRYRLSEGSGAAKLLYFKPLFNEPLVLWTFEPKDQETVVSASLAASTSVTDKRLANPT